MRQLDEVLLQTFVDRLNQRLNEEAESRRKEVERGLETAELGGLIVQKIGYGMDAAVQLLSQLLDVRLPAAVDFDSATAVVDPNWRENMQSRWKHQAGIDRSSPRPSPSLTGPLEPGRL